jgi:hypothetical protein
MTTGEDNEMNRKRFHRTAGVALLVALAASAFACGGGGGDSNPAPGPIVATFTGSNPSPGANTLGMTGAGSGSPAFSVLVNVTSITDFFGAAFRVTFNPASASFSSFSSAGSFIGTGAGTDFRATLVSPGVLSVAATRQGQVQGITAAGTQLLITLNFTATAETASNPFGFGVAAERVVTTCPAPPAACSDVADGTLTWSGGTLSASR